MLNTKAKILNVNYIELFWEIWRGRGLDRERDFIQCTLQP